MRREEIVAALTALGARLSEQGIDGELYVVGGAAIAIAFDARRATRDIDAVFEPKQEVYAAADQVGAELGLPPGWLNDGAKGFVAGADDEAATALEVPGLRVLVASPRILLAMKVLAHRIGEDDDDVRLLAGELELPDAAAVLAVAEKVYGDRLDAAARFFVEELFA
jgi:Nucleotidyltransferase of unknown function (DUF6036)